MLAPYCLIKLQEYYQKNIYAIDCIIYHIHCYILGIINRIIYIYIYIKSYKTTIL